MPQELHVLRCYSCETFQVQIVKKVPKWQCKICNEKQSVKKVYAKGSGKDCRQYVQELNLKRGEIASHVEDEQDVDTSQYLHNFEEWIPGNPQSHDNAHSSKWSEFVEASNEVESLPEWMSKGDQIPSQPSHEGDQTSVKKRKQNNFKSPEWFDHHFETSEKFVSQSSYSLSVEVNNSSRNNHSSHKRMKTGFFNGVDQSQVYADAHYKTNQYHDNFSKQASQSQFYTNSKTDELKDNVNNQLYDNTKGLNGKIHNSNNNSSLLSKSTNSKWAQFMAPSDSENETLKTNKVESVLNEPCSTKPHVEAANSSQNLGLTSSFPKTTLASETFENKMREGDSCRNVNFQSNNFEVCDVELYHASKDVNTNPSSGRNRFMSNHYTDTLTGKRESVQEATNRIKSYQCVLSNENEEDLDELLNFQWL